MNVEGEIMAQNKAEPKIRLSIRKNGRTHPELFFNMRSLF